jgi:hypothetical protein
MGRSDEWGGRGGGGWGEADGFVLRSRFSLYTKRKVTQTSRMRASVCRSQSRLALYVIDPNREGGGDKNLTDRTAVVKSGTENFTVESIQRSSDVR